MRPVKPATHQTSFRSRRALAVEQLEDGVRPAYHWDLAPILIEPDDGPVPPLPEDEPRPGDSGYFVNLMDADPNSVGDVAIAGDESAGDDESQDSGPMAGSVELFEFDPDSTADLRLEE